MDSQAMVGPLGFIRKTEPEKTKEGHLEWPGSRADPVAAETAETKLHHLLAQNKTTPQKPSSEVHSTMTAAALCKCMQPSRVTLKS